MTFKIGINWHLRFREEIAQLKEELQLTQIWLERAERQLEKYENNNTRTSWNGKDNNIVKLSERISKKWD
tara:strand:+ start:276 stop:485 length:210 start_codon:yes stop_codon:yes gene_type:complete